MPKVNPELLIWARETAGMDIPEAAKRIGLRDTRHVSASLQLLAFESGEEAPTPTLLLAMAKAYRRPLTLLYLLEKPKSGERGEDFRAGTGSVSPVADPLVDSLIRDVIARQRMIRELLLEFEAEPIDLVGKEAPTTTYESLAESLRATLGFSLDTFREQKNAESAFGYLRGLCESKGIFVLLSGNLGSHHSNISPRTFRGYAVADKIAPLIVVNDQDAKQAWSFTLLHELAHISLGLSGLSGQLLGRDTEKLCDAVASSILLPAAELAATSIGSLEPDAQLNWISNFARPRHLSRLMVANRLRMLGAIDRTRYEQIDAALQAEWEQSKESRRAREGRDKGPDYYTVRRHRLGKALVMLTRNSIQAGILSRTKAAFVLGVSPRNVDELVSSPLKKEAA